MAKEKCTSADYAALTSRYELKEVVTRLPLVGILATLYESQYRPATLRNLIELLRRDDRWTSYRDLADGYYALMGEPGSMMSEEDRVSKTARYEKELEAFGVPKAMIRSYVLDRAAESPRCLGQISVEFIYFTKAGTTELRGKSMLEKIREFIKKNGRAPSDLDEIPLDQTDPFFGKDYDGWSRPFVLVEENRLLKLSSTGADGKSSVPIGEVLLSGR